jgi:hypothetical protein
MQKVVHNLAISSNGSVSRISFSFQKSKAPEPCDWERRAQNICEQPQKVGGDSFQLYDVPRNCYDKSKD